MHAHTHNMDVSAKSKETEPEKQETAFAPNNSQIEQMRGLRIPPLYPLPASTTTYVTSTCEEKTNKLNFDKTFDSARTFVNI